MVNSKDQSEKETSVLDVPQWQDISEVTIAHYDQSAEDYWAGTRDHDVGQNYTAFLTAMKGAPPLSILDLGCGPGRDLKYFCSLGHDAVGLDGSKNFVKMAQAYCGCDVLHQNFLELKLPENRFDGVFANASIFHVPSKKLPDVLLTLYTTMKPRGVLFCSNPRGNNEEGFSGNRYGCFMNLETWRKYVTRAGFVELQHYFRPAGLPLDKQPWLASVWRKN